MGQQPCCISSCWVLCAYQGRGEGGSWEGGSWEGGSSWRDFGDFFAWPLKFDTEQPSKVLNACLHLVFLSERKLTIIITYRYTILANNALVCALWSICLAMRKTPSPPPVVWIPLSLPQTLQARRHALPRTWRQCRQLLSPWPQPSCLQFLGHFRLWTMLARFSYLVSSTSSFHHQVSDLRWSFLERPQTSVAASRKWPFSFDQADSTQFAESTSAPTVTAAAAVKFKFTKTFIVTQYHVHARNTKKCIASRRSINTYQALKQLGIGYT